MRKSSSLFMGAMMALLTAACSETTTAPEAVAPNSSAMEAPKAGPVFTEIPGSLQLAMTPPGDMTVGGLGSIADPGGGMITYTEIKRDNFTFLAWVPFQVAVVLGGGTIPLQFDEMTGGGEDEVVAGAVWSGSFPMMINGQVQSLSLRVLFNASGLVSAASLDSVGFPSYGAAVVIPGTSASIHATGEVFWQGMWQPLSVGFGSIAQTIGSSAIPVSVSVGRGFYFKMATCEAGNFRDVSAGSCVAAPAGSYSAGEYATSATQCAQGTYQPDTGQSSCIDADAGYYVNQFGMTSQTACGNGKYQPDTGQSGCLSAPPGSYANGLAQTSATLCSPGYFAGGFSNTSCTAAPRGTYVADSGAANQVACAAGTYNNSIAQTSCQLAPAGYYVAGTGAFTPTQCAAGSFSSTSGSVSCTLAPPGSYVANAGATGSTQCAAGYYQPDSGATSCIAASIGFYVPGAGSASQTACAAGYTTNSVASTSCVKMDPIAAYDALIAAAQTTPGVPASEVNKLVTARKQLVGGKPSNACKAIDGFVSYVNKQTGKTISSANAAILIRKTQDADASIGC
ncbi:MAG TPA: hypothetical protein VF042_13440 [Gemmatimonadaceae bacterium]